MRSTKTPIDQKENWKNALFFNIGKILRKGSIKPYNFEMLYQVNPIFKHETHSTEFFSYLTSKRKLTLSNLAQYNKLYFSSTAIYLFLSLLFQAFVPLLLNQLIRWLTSEKSQKWEGFLIVFFISFCLIFKIFFNSHYLRNYWMLWAQIRNTLGVNLILLV